MKKIIVNENLFEELQHYKSGNLQNAYISNKGYIVKKPKYGFFSNREIKLYKIMQSYPSLFAKVYKIEKDEVWQEKLDDNAFIKDLKSLSKHFAKDYFIGSDPILTETELLDSIIYTFQYHQDENLKKIIVGLDGELFKFAKKLLNFCTILNNFEKKQEMSFDIHSKQFGYDDKHDIKVYDI